MTIQTYDCKDAQPSQLQCGGRFVSLEEHRRVVAELEREVRTARLAVDTTDRRTAIDAAAWMLHNDVHENWPARGVKALRMLRELGVTGVDIREVEERIRRQGA